jgi:hypothetical protein
LNDFPSSGASLHVLDVQVTTQQFLIDDVSHSTPRLTITSELSLDVGCNFVTSLPQQLADDLAQTLRCFWFVRQQRFEPFALNLDVVIVYINSKHKNARLLSGHFHGLGLLFAALMALISATISSTSSWVGSPV